ncbi:MAG: flagellar basal body-associated FliL family protein [Calditrichae bacterium]|nr:flagellar basal body-associated FliL family protein [Calditrichota bacterium]MCB9059250.1 flagellar basal body-associated FliL family protein [Calditrichia bacterium]
MAEEEKIEEQEQQEEVFDDKKKKKVLYLVVILAQLIIAGFLIWYFVWPEYEEFQGLDESITEVKGESVDEDEESEPKELGVMYQIENLTVNPKGTRGMRFAVFEFSLEVPSEETKQELDKYKTVLIDNYIKYFRSRSIVELSKDSMTDSLKIDIARITDEILGEKVVQNVYFTRFVLE